MKHNKDIQGVGNQLLMAHQRRLETQNVVSGKFALKHLYHCGYFTPWRHLQFSFKWKVDLYECNIVCIDWDHILNFLYTWFFFSILYGAQCCYFTIVTSSHYVITLHQFYKQFSISEHVDSFHFLFSTFFFQNAFWLLLVCNLTSSLSYSSLAGWAVTISWYTIPYFRQDYWRRCA